MEIKNPVHPGALVMECLEDLSLSVAEAAKGLGISRQQLHNVIAGRSSITPEMAIRFEKAFGSTADTWLRMQINYDLAQARKRAHHIIVARLAPKGLDANKERAMKRLKGGFHLGGSPLTREEAHER
jgi:antitoxin HigA-1